MQREAFTVLTRHNIMPLLGGYTPMLAGTFPLDIAVKGSDLDILCYWQDAEVFKQDVTRHFSGFNGFTLREAIINNQKSIIANFFADGLEVEIFGQNIPVKEQLGYSHMVIEYKILQQKGDDFKNKIIALKQSGLKTEPAFAQLLGLNGNPYLALLEYVL
ncbi:DUF4269 domain-containing protein [Flavobacterium zepuense]|uniref:DUF4269 domain-containing protein n=2 Tax=Flavobacterium zepuense TaxID=2593302 RepID=A0A552V698_9FLAO|nr:DUF4269 domain-containing protein [Flavobacterium zepuense]